MKREYDVSSTVYVVRRVIVAIALCGLAASVAARSRSVWDGTYTRTQAGRGKTVYVETCARCHGESFLGGDDSPALVGDDFLKRWNGKSVGKLFDVVRTKMPSDGPAILSRRQCADVVAFLLSTNEFPAGQTELETDDAALADIQIEPKR